LISLGLGAIAERFDKLLREMDVILIKMTGDWSQ